MAFITASIHLLLLLCLCLLVQNSVSEENLVGECSADFKFPLKSGVSPNHFDKYGRTALHKAAARGHTNDVKLLLKNGALPNHSDWYGRSALHYAAVNARTDTVKLLLENGASIHQHDGYDLTALHLGVIGNEINVVKLLVENGADPNTKALFSNAQLNLATCTYDLAVISWLLKAKANKNLDKNSLQLAESKLQLLQKNWQKESMETADFLTELKRVIQLISSCFEKQQVLKLKLEKYLDIITSVEGKEVEPFDYQMSIVLEKLQALLIHNQFSVLMGK